MVWVETGSERRGLTFLATCDALEALPVVICLITVCSSVADSFLEWPAGRFSLPGSASLARVATLDLDTPV